MTEDANRIVLVGSIYSSPEYDHTLFGESFYHTEIKVSRLSGAVDTLPITVSGRLLRSELTCGDRYCIHGQIRSYNQKNEIGSKLIITVFARELELIDADYAEGLADKNEVELSGHICKPVIYRTTPFSREISDMLIAVNRRYGKSDYLPCIAWGRNARYTSELDVGDRVRISGRLQSRSYQKALPDGGVEQRVAYEISCSAIEEQGVDESNSVNV